MTKFAKNWRNFFTAQFRKRAMDHKGYGSAANIDSVGYYKIYICVLSPFGTLDQLEMCVLHHIGSMGKCEICICVLRHIGNMGNMKYLFV